MVWIVCMTEYWRNYRGESGSMRSLQAAFDSKDKATRYIAHWRSCGIDAQTKDTSDEPDRWLRLTDRVTGFVKSDMWIEEMELQ